MTKILTVLLLTIGLVIAYTIAINMPRRRQLQALQNARPGWQGFESFRKMFPDLSETLLKGTYRSLQDALGTNDFPIRPEDDLERTLMIDRGNLYNILEQIMEKQLGRDLTPEDEAKMGPVATVQDFVIFTKICAESTTERADRA